MKKKLFNSDTFAAIHASAIALHKVGEIDKATMRCFDESCLTATREFTPREIQKLCEAITLASRYLRDI
jgi:putative transcriptional regulator